MGRFGTIVGGCAAAVALGLVVFAVLPARPGSQAGESGLAADPGSARAQIELPAVGVHPGAIHYWENPYYANALAAGRWLEFRDGDWGRQVSVWQNPQFDDSGYPRYLRDGWKLRGLLFGLHAEHAELAAGHVVLSWQGDADIRLDKYSEYLADESSGEPQGSLTNGRRVYRFAGGEQLGWLTVEAINPANPPTAIRVSLADPADPQWRSLEHARWHPLFLQRLVEADWGVMRGMDLLATNGNPQRDWSDRRRPGHVFASGELHPRSPAPGVKKGNGRAFAGGRDTGIPYEHLVDLANLAGLDLWINVPHLASDAFVTKLARLIRYGSDGHEPYSQPVPDPVWPGLHPHLRLFVEYSNEIWSRGEAFAQGDWAEQQGQAATPPLSKAQWNAMRVTEIWRLFDAVFADPARIVNVAAVQTANRHYIRQFLGALDAVHGEPGAAADIVAVTTYMGSGIEEWVHDTAQGRAGSDDPWFYTTAYFDAGGGKRPVSLPADDPYWRSPRFARHQREAFDEWERRLRAGLGRRGKGPDATDWRGGFPGWVREEVRAAFGADLPLVAYEGGPSIYTSRFDGGDPRDDGITRFIMAMNRNPAIESAYRSHLQAAFGKGLRMHMPFTLSGRWGKHGQWGHLESLEQPNEQAPKYRAVLDWSRSRMRSAQD